MRKIILLSIAVLIMSSCGFNNQDDYESNSYEQIISFDKYECFLVEKECNKASGIENMYFYDIPEQDFEAIYDSCPDDFVLGAKTYFCEYTSDELLEWCKEAESLDWNTFIITDESNDSNDWRNWISICLVNIHQKEIKVHIGSYF